MVDRLEIIGFFTVSFSIAVECRKSESVTCLSSTYDTHWTNCYYGCCGNSTVHGYGTIPCCESDELPHYTYLLLGVGFLIPFAICLMILRKAGERCRTRQRSCRRSRRDEDLRGSMPGLRGTSLMVATIADILSASRRGRDWEPAEVVKPPSYDDALKESPPAYKDVYQVETDSPDTSYVPPPCYSLSQNSESAITQVSAHGAEPNQSGPSLSTIVPEMPPEYSLRTSIANENQGFVSDTADSECSIDTDCESHVSETCDRISLSNR